MSRDMSYLNKNRIIYRRGPINDKPTETYEWGSFYEAGTHECYELFRSKAKITSYKSLKWHLLVLWYLNPKLDQDKFEQLAYYIAEKSNGFVTFTIPEMLLKNIIYEVSMSDLDYPPKNRIRKVIFKDTTGLTKQEKLSIVGKLIGRSKVTEDIIYSTMIEINHIGEKITLSKIAQNLNCSVRTLHRNMSKQLKQEKESLNEEI